MANYPKYQLYGFGKGDRSVRAAWLLAELGIPYELKELSWENGDHEKPEYLLLNPMGFCPTMLEDGRPMYESVAMMMYLADKHRDIRALAPSLDSPLRAQYMQWCVFVAATVDYKFSQMMMLKFMGPPDAFKEKGPELASELKHIGRVIEKAIDGKEYIIGNEFSAADILVGSMAYWLLQPEVCPEHEFPLLNAYCTRLTKRPAAQQTGGFTE